jgi:DNA-binding CsgD family transcriptional regulator
MKAGALDFLALPFVDAHLLDVMETAFKKDNAASAATLQEEELYRRWRSLTSREAEVMRYVVAGFLNKQTAGELNIAENTVQVHRGRIMRKMHADSFAALVRMSLRLEGRKEPISVPRTQTSPSFGEMWEAAALGPELSNAIGTLARTPVNSHISPKPGEIWGTHVRG